MATMAKRLEYGIFQAFTLPKQPGPAPSTQTGGSADTVEVHAKKKSKPLPAS